VTSGKYIPYKLSDAHLLTMLYSSVLPVDGEAVSIVSLRILAPVFFERLRTWF
jgi:hypothetical protein